MAASELWSASGKACEKIRCVFRSVDRGLAFGRSGNGVMAKTDKLFVLGISGHPTLRKSHVCIRLCAWGDSMYTYDCTRCTR